METHRGFHKQNQASILLFYTGAVFCCPRGWRGGNRHRMKSVPGVGDRTDLVLYVPQQHLRPTSTRTSKLVNQLPRGVEKHRGDSVDVQHLVHLRVTVEVDLVEHCSRASEGVGLRQKAQSMSKMVARSTPGHVRHYSHKLPRQRLVHRTQKALNSV